MAENQNDNRGQQNDSKSTQQNQDGAVKREVNPNNPTARGGSQTDQQKQGTESQKGTQQGSQQGNQSRSDAATPQGKTDPNTRNAKEDEEGEEGDRESRNGDSFRDASKQ